MKSAKPASTSPNEHPHRVVKQQFGYAMVRYRGLG